jgi:hypothetical protein
MISHLCPSASLFDSLTHTTHTHHRRSLALSNTNPKKTDGHQTTTAAERKDPTAFLSLWLGSLGLFTILYAIFVHKLQ